MNAADVVMPFGRHKGKTLGEIADEDVLYLDWLNEPDRNIRSQELVLAVAEMCSLYAAQIDDALEAGID